MRWRRRLLRIGGGVTSALEEAVVAYWRGPDFALEEAVVAAYWRGPDFVLEEAVVLCWRGPDFAVEGASILCWRRLGTTERTLNSQYHLVVGIY